MRLAFQVHLPFHTAKSSDSRCKRGVHHKFGTTTTLRLKTSNHIIVPKQLEVILTLSLNFLHFGNIEQLGPKMHYIRFLKPPQISAGVLTAKLTITTDLGDDFLNADLPLQLVMHQSTWKDRVIGDPLRQPNIVEWKAGMRELPIFVPLPPTSQLPELRKGNGGVEGWQLLVWPCLTGVKVYKDLVPEPVKYSKKGKPLPARGPNTREYDGSDCLLELLEVLKINRGEPEEYSSVKGLVLSAESATYNLVDKEQKISATISRVFGTTFSDDNDIEIIIEEETGNSIARHIWDAGVVFSALLQELATVPDKWNSPVTYLLPLRNLLRDRYAPSSNPRPSEEPDANIDEYEKDLNVLELGTGCAIVSATLSHLLPYARVVATDLEDAKEVAEKNLERNRFQKIDRGDLMPSDSSFETLDWTEPLSGRAAERRWDLILVADCTYNSDVVPDLVKTLRALVDSSPEVMIAVALKWRHDSEAIFHELMKENRMLVVDKHTEKVANFDVDATGKEEEIEIYLFKDEKAGEEAKEEEVGRKRTLIDPVSEQPIKK